MTFLLLREEKYKFPLKQNILTFEKNILNEIVQKGILCEGYDMYIDYFIKIYA